MSDIKAKDVIYDGTTNPVEFKRNYKILSLIQEWDDTAQLSNLEYFLKGKALNAYSGSAFKKSNIKEALDSIVTACSLPAETLLQHFYDRRRMEGESLATFAFSLESLLKKASTELSDQQRLPLLKNQLLKDLPDFLKALVSFNTDLSWDALVKALDNASISVTTKPEPVNSQPIFGIPQIKEEQIDFNYSRGPIQQKTARFSGNCHYCNIAGHRIAQCRKRARDESNGQLRNARNNWTNAHNEEYPFFASNNSTVVQATLGTTYSLGSGVDLMMISVSVILFGDNSQVFSALVDSGSTHSFISPNILSNKQITIAADLNDKRCVRRNFVINGSTGTAKSSCCITRAEIEIGPWNGTHDFVISGSVTKYDMVLGKDFLNKYKVDVHHGDDKINLQGYVIDANSLIVKPSSNLSEIDDLRAQVAALSELIKDKALIAK